MSAVQKYCVFLVALGVLIFVAAPAAADWKVGDSYKMHFPQLPDEDGWDVNATSPRVLADDWTCSETGPVQDIHFWGSWKGGLTGVIQSFHLSIHANVPVGPGTIFSHPGQLLWDYNAYDGKMVPIDPPAKEGWYDPAAGQFIEDDHQHYFQYNITLPQTNWFPQTKGTVYWLDISANVVGGMWGWKTADVSKYPGQYAGQHYLDDAVWSGGAATWQPLDDPLTGVSLDMAFVITPEPGTLVLLAMAGLGVGLFAWRRRK